MPDQLARPTGNPTRVGPRGGWARTSRCRPCFRSPANMVTPAFGSITGHVTRVKMRPGSHFAGPSESPHAGGIMVNGNCAGLRPGLQDSLRTWAPGRGSSGAARAVRTDGGANACGGGMNPPGLRGCRSGRGYGTPASWENRKPAASRRWVSFTVAPLPRPSGSDAPNLQVMRLVVHDGTYWSLLWFRTVVSRGIFVDRRAPPRGRQSSPEVTAQIPFLLRCHASGARR